MQALSHVWSRLFDIHVAPVGSQGAAGASRTESTLNIAAAAKRGAQPRIERRLEKRKQMGRSMRMKKDGNSDQHDDDEEDGDTTKEYEMKHFRSLSATQFGPHPRSP